MGLNGTDYIKHKKIGSTSVTGGNGHQFCTYSLTNKVLNIDHFPNIDLTQAKMSSLKCFIKNDNKLIINDQKVLIKI